MNLIKKLLFLLLILANDTILAQSSYLYLSNPSVFNPSFIGNTPNLRINQESILANFSNGREFKNYLLALDWNASNGVNRHGFGFSTLVEDQTGLSRYQLNLKYAYHLPLSDSISLSTGFQGGYLQYTIQQENFIFYNDLVIGTSNEDFSDFQRGTFTGGIGFNLQNHSTKQKFLPPSWLGASYKFSFNSDNEAILFRPYFFIHGGLRLTTGIYSRDQKNDQKIRFHPNFALYLIDNTKRLDLGLFISDNLSNFSFGFGGWIRNLLNDNQFIYTTFALGKDFFKVNYSINIPLQENLGEISGLIAHQVGVQFIFDGQKTGVNKYKSLNFKSKKAKKKLNTQKRGSHQKKSPTELVDPTYFNKLIRR